MRLVILGDPVDHSLSPAIHTAAFAAAGLSGEYTVRRVDAAGLEDAIEEVRAGGLSGGNVTMPHKELAAELCDRLAPSAERAGAVNTLVRNAGRVVGHNTDIVGIQRAWAECGLTANGPIHLLGAGGAAAAALIALEGREVYVSARRRAAAEATAARVGVSAEFVEWGEPVAGAVVVNATPIGMEGERIDEALITAATGLFDMVYRRGSTPAADLARSLGIPVAAGQRMLLHQGAEAFELWTGHRAPLEAMRAAMAR